MAMGAWMSPERLVGATPPVAVVEQTEYVLTLVQQVEEIPTDVYEQLVVLSSQPLPDQWFDAGCVVPVVRETADSSEAMVGAVEFTNSLEQNALGIGAVGIAATAGVYTDRVKICLSLSHAKAWALVKKCGTVVEGVTFAAAGICALGCLLTGPGWVACVTSCLTMAGIGLAVVSASCLATYIALLTVSILLCTLGCIGV